MRLVPNETHLGIVLCNGLTYQLIGPLQKELHVFLLEPLHDCGIDIFAACESVGLQEFLHGDEHTEVTL
jgi:hypothetical protein